MWNCQNIVKECTFVFLLSIIAIKRNNASNDSQSGGALKNASKCAECAKGCKNQSTFNHLS